MGHGGGVTTTFLWEYCSLYVGQTVYLTVPPDVPAVSDTPTGHFKQKSEGPFVLRGCRFTSVFLTRAPEVELFTQRTKIRAQSNFLKPFSGRGSFFLFRTAAIKSSKLSPALFTGFCRQVVIVPSLDRDDGSETDY